MNIHKTNQVEISQDDQMDKLGGKVTNAFLVELFDWWFDQLVCIDDTHML
jgi:hypothetical protein